MYTDAQHEKGHQARAGSPSRARPCPADPLGAFYAAHNGYVSDKWHTYLEVYSQVFRAYRDRPVRIMEIGVQNGGSLEIWRRYFPRAEIVVGCDINPKCADLTYDDPAIHVVTGDARAAHWRRSHPYRTASTSSSTMAPICPPILLRPSRSIFQNSPPAGFTWSRTCIAATGCTTREGCRRLIPAFRSSNALRIW
jgi:hypothetical protein